MSHTFQRLVILNASLSQGKLRLFYADKDMLSRLMVVDMGEAFNDLDFSKRECQQFAVTFICKMNEKINKDLSGEFKGATFIPVNPPPVELEAKIVESYQDRHVDAVRGPTIGYYKDKPIPDFITVKGEQYDYTGIHMRNMILDPRSQIAMDDLLFERKKPAP